MQDKPLKDIKKPEQSILIVEDSSIFAFVLLKAVKENLNLNACLCKRYDQAREILQKQEHNFFAALLDLNLPDAPEGELVDLVVGEGIPSIVFTGELSDKLRERIGSRRIVDYVLKDSKENVQQVVDTIKRLYSNMGMKILVADDSAVSRKMIKDLLEVWNFSVLEAGDGRQALAMLQENEGINMLLTDYNMPGMNGVELVKNLRNSFSKTRLPVIGLSGVGGATTSAHFLKAGANDYMHKPFLAEELYCRVRHNLETSEYILTIREMAERDFLTGLLNRRAFFSSAQTLFANAKRGNIKLVVAMMDIDHFKKCNDQYGHDAGDEVIRAVGQTIYSRLRSSDLIARFGGEEYCMACVNMDPADVFQVFDSVRKAVQDDVIDFAGHEIQVTVSSGVCAQLMDSLEEMITRADHMLYQAKQQGRNQVQVDAPS